MSVASKAQGTVAARLLLLHLLSEGHHHRVVRSRHHPSAFRAFPPVVRSHRSSLVPHPDRRSPPPPTHTPKLRPLLPPRSPAAINHRAPADGETIERATTTMTAVNPPFLIGALCGRCGRRASHCARRRRHDRRSNGHRATAAGLALRRPSVARGIGDAETPVKTDALFVVRYRFIINSRRATTTTTTTTSAVAAAVEARSSGNRPRVDSVQFLSTKLLSPRTGGRGTKNKIHIG
jgi:hypothetical protein